MKIYVMRHAPREPSDDFSEAEEGDPDAEITSEGEEIASAMGAWLAENEDVPSVIYASPTVRTQQTADRVADAIEEAGFVRPRVQTELGIAPYMSIRGLVQKIASDDDQDNALVISHSQTILRGLQAMNVDNGDTKKPDPHAAGEIRTLKVKRKSGAWREKGRIRPSDLGYDDTY